MGETWRKFDQDFREGAVGLGDREADSRRWSGTQGVGKVVW
jgi:hypothetical protein